MSEPIKLPPCIPATSEARNYARLAVEQATAELRALLERRRKKHEATFLELAISQRERAEAVQRAEAAAAEVERLREDYGQACKLVADMHAAATGRPGEGPRLGVVEDVAAVRAELDAFRADAERYRFANDSEEDFAICYWDETMGNGGEWMCNGSKGNAIDLLDAAINAALKETK